MSSKERQEYFRNYIDDKVKLHVDCVKIFTVFRTPTANRLSPSINFNLRFRDDTYTSPRSATTIVHFGESSSRFVFICRTCNTWYSRHTRHSKITRTQASLISASRQSWQRWVALSSNSPRRILAGQIKGFLRLRTEFARNEKKIASMVVALATRVGTLRDSTAASYPKFSFVGCVLH